MKLADKLIKVDDTFEVTRFDNGFKVEVGGRDKAENWSRAKIVVSHPEDVVALFDEYQQMEKDD